MAVRVKAHGVSSSPQALAVHLPKSGRSHVRALEKVHQRGPFGDAAFAHRHTSIKNSFICEW